MGAKKRKADSYRLDDDLRAKFRGDGSCATRRQNREVDRRESDSNPGSIPSKIVLKVPNPPQDQSIDDTSALQEKNSRNESVAGAIPKKAERRIVLDKVNRRWWRTIRKHKPSDFGTFQKGHAHETAPRKRSRRPTIIDSEDENQASSLSEGSKSAGASFAPAEAPSVPDPATKARAVSAKGGMPNSANELAGSSIDLPVEQITSDTAVDLTIYNKELKALGKGKLQENRTRRATEITFATVWARNPTDVGKIFFYSHRRHLGGPYALFSNFYESSFTIHNDDGQRLEFRSVEHFYQFNKALVMRPYPERTCEVEGVLVDDEPPTSKNLFRAMGIDTLQGVDYAALGRCFDKHSDKAWRERWQRVWVKFRPGVLYYGVQAKFKDNLDLREVLMMTGNYKLFEAADKDAVCGIGKHARDAHCMDEAKFGQNLLGKALMQVRDEIRKQEPWWNGEIAHEYFREFEIYLRKNRENSERMDKLSHWEKLQEKRNDFLRGVRIRMLEHKRKVSVESTS